MAQAGKKEYLRYVSLSYNDIVTELNKIHGRVKHNYGQPDDMHKIWGLSRHHVLEDQYENLSNKKNASKVTNANDKKNLVYVDAIEHMILHAKIYEMRKLALIKPENGSGFNLTYAMNAYKSFEARILKWFADGTVISDLPEVDQIEREHLPAFKKEDVDEIITAIKSLIIIQ